MVKKALILYINKYDQPGFKLLGCKNDAFLWKNALSKYSKKIGWELELYCFPDLTSLDALIKIEEFISSLKNNECGILFFSGHGISHQIYVDSIGDVGLHGLLFAKGKVLYDFELYEKIKKIKEGTKLLMIIDSCHSLGIYSPFLYLVRNMMAQIHGSIVSFFQSPFNSSAIFRQVENGVVKKISIESIDSSESGISQRAREFIKKNGLDITNLKLRDLIFPKLGNVHLFSAGDDKTSLAYENKLDTKNVYGVLSYHATKVLDSLDKTITLAELEKRTNYQIGLTKRTIALNHQKVKMFPEDTIHNLNFFE